MIEKTISEETPQILSTISAFIKEYRIQSGLTQVTLSEIAEGMHPNTISHIENGCSYNIKSLIEISLALDLPLRELFWEL